MTSKVNPTRLQCDSDKAGLLAESQNHDDLFAASGCKKTGLSAAMSADKRFLLPTAGVPVLTIRSRQSLGSTHSGNDARNEK